MIDASASSAPTLYRKCGCDGASDSCESCAENAELQRTAANSQSSGAVPSIVNDVIASGGRPLDASTRAFFEIRFGKNLGDVRVHSDTTAARSAHAVNALAYTVGNHVAFGDAQYAPETAAGRRVLAHELAHTVQQAGGAQNRSVAPLRISAPSDAAEIEASATAARVLDDQAAAASSIASADADVLHRVPPDEPAKAPSTADLMYPFAVQCPEIPSDKWIKKVVVKQESPQSVTATWNDDSTDSGPCSTGKGHCCVDPANPTGVACTETRSRTSDTNCTPITSGAGLPVLKKVLDHKGVNLWTEIDSARAIALHAYSPVDGTPLSHGCVRMHDDMACKIFHGSRVGKTMVQIQGFARPMCDHAALQDEWKGDFRMGGKDLSKADGDERGEIVEARKELNDAFGRKLSVAEIQALDETDIPKCTSTRALPVAPAAPVAPAPAKPNPSEIF
jgi:hypothetical protein